jgi:tripartite-type tricarboxylate transporter receptor subunit TctC
MQQKITAVASGAVMFLGTSVVGASTSFAQTAVEGFYKGKQIILQTGSSPGDGYDLYGRLVSRHISQYIPGKPNIITQYVPGGGSLALANQFGNITPRDGSVFGLFNSGMSTTPLLNPTVTQYDPRKFKYIGSPNREGHVLMTWGDAPAKTFEDLFNMEIIAGATAPGSAPYEFPKVTNALIGTKMKIVVGYKGSTETVLAMQRGEIQAYPGMAWVSAKQVYGEFIAQGKIKILAQYGMNKHPDLANVPLFPTGKTEEERQIFELLYARQSFGRPFAFPADVPMDRVDAFRKALVAVMQDPEFVADAKRASADLSLVTGEELQALTDRLFGTAPDVLKRARALLSD